MDNEIEKLLEQLGGVPAVSGATNVPYTTVYSWKTSGRIPRWRRPVIAELARGKGVALPSIFDEGDGQ